MLSSRRSLLYLATSIYFLAALSSAASLYSRQNEVNTIIEQPTSSTDDSNENCGFDGDDNTYGKGIRIGVYLQWITSALAYSFVRDEAVTMRGVNSCFQTAMLVGLLYITIDKGPELYAAEALIVLTMGMGGICSGTDTPNAVKGNSSSIYRVSTAGGLIRVILSMGFIAYGVWFFFGGMDHMRRDPCSTYAFFFTKVNMYNWFRTLMQVVFTIIAICYGLFMLASIRLLSRPLVTAASKFFNAILCGGTGNKYHDIHAYGGTIKVLLGISLVLFILGTELLLKWNNVTNISSLQSTGQILPLVMAIGSLGKVLHSGFAELYWTFRRVD